MCNPCPYVCINKNSFGYCQSTGCINPNYQIVEFNGTAQGNNRTIYKGGHNKMKAADYSTLCYILGKIEGISWGAKDQKIKDALTETSEALSSLLESLKIDVEYNQQ